MFPAHHSSKPFKQISLSRLRCAVSLPLPGCAYFDTCYLFLPVMLCEARGYLIDNIEHENRAVHSGDRIRCYNAIRQRLDWMILKFESKVIYSLSHFKFRHWYVCLLSTFVSESPVSHLHPCNFIWCSRIMFPYAGGIVCLYYNTNIKTSL